MSVNGTYTKRRPVSHSHPCPVCQGKDGCSVEADASGADGLIFCRRRTGQQPGFRYIGQAGGDPQFSLYRAEDDTRSGHFRMHAPPGGRQTTDWPALAARFQRNLTADLAAELAAALGLPAHALDALPVGYNPADPRGRCWTFPEVLGDGLTICGISRRFADGGKMAMPGGSRGLTVPVDWLGAPGPVLLPEGPSDVLALAGALGLSAVGRPSNTGGVRLLAALLTAVPPDREIIVLGEFDPKQDGTWPGLTGAKETAAKLTAELKRPVTWALTPDGAKDARRWLLDQADYGVPHG